ncbi:MAG: hypothetical protein ACLQUW_03005 [Desulfobaccales bacterium]
MEKDGPAPARVARRAPLASLLRYVSRVMPPPLPLLPPGSRWLRQRKDLLLLAVEDPPQCRTLRVSGGKKGEDGYRSYRLAFPYLIYLLTFRQDIFEEMKMFFRVAPLASPGDTLYHTCLPNVRGEPGHYGSQRVCLRYRPEMVEGVPLAEAVPALLDFFWSTGFNQDISNSAFERASGLLPDPRLADLAAWEKATAADPLFPLEVDWEAADRKLPDLWAECLKLHGENGQPVQDAMELADILFRLPVGY